MTVSYHSITYCLVETLLIRAVINSVHRYFEHVEGDFSFVFNSSSNFFDLHIVNVSVSDEGIYYCAERERSRVVFLNTYNFDSQHIFMSICELLIC